MDPDLRHRTTMDSLDDRHETTDQKGSAAAMRGSRPGPPCMVPVAPLFHPYRPTRTRQDLPCTNAGEPAPPDGGFDVTGRRAISGPLTPANRGLSRSLTDGLVRRSGSVETRMAQIPKMTVRVPGLYVFAARDIRGMSAPGSPVISGSFPETGPSP
jgi:hypothetical protein